MAKSKALPGPSRLSGIIKSLHKPPRLQLASLKAIQLTFAARNDDFGCRRFVNEDLPKVQFANPDLEVRINRVPKSPGDTWKAEMQLDYKNGMSSTLDASRKWSGAILEQLMDAAGGDRWQDFKAERRAAGREPVFPVIPGRQTEVKKEGVGAALP